MSMLDVQQLSVAYGEDLAVADLSFSIAAGESVGLLGESGSGKTQTALAILGLNDPAAQLDGSIRFREKEMLRAAGKTLDEIRARRIAMIFQDPALALNPYLRIGDQIARILMRHRALSKTAAHSRTVAMLERVGLPDPDRQCRAYPHQLSGGMRQRAMIASALITEPELLIADEPTTALDVTVQAQILDLLRTIRQETALLLITHDLGVVAGNCERLLVMEKGRLVEAGTTAEIFTSPRAPHTKKLIASALRLDGVDVPAPRDTETLLEVAGSSVSYGRGADDLHAVRDVSMQLRAGETLAIVGESGSGKSSLVRGILGLVPVSAGTVSFAGKLLPQEDKDRAASLRRDLQLVFQDPLGSLNPQMRIRTIVSEPLHVHEPQLSSSERDERVLNMLLRVGLDETFMARYPHQLSGGQAQRVAIARAIILKPRVLVCDEAVAALDGTVREQILALLRDLQAETGLSVLFISHDLGVVRAISHRVLVMYLGRLVELAGNEALFTSPRHPYTRALIDSVPVPDPGAPARTASLRGEVPSVMSPPGGCAFHPRCAYAVERCTRDLPAARAIAETSVACHRADELSL